MKAKLKVLSLASLASFSLMGVLAVNSFANGGFTLMKAGESNERTFTLTADTIAAALGSDSSATNRKAADFTYWGLEFHIDKAYYADGKINVSGGVLYNVTLAGSSVGENQVVGTGFKKIEIKGYEADVGMSTQFYDKDNKMLQEVGLGADAGDKTAAFTGSGMAAKCYFAFGGGTTKGISFSSIVYTYTCGYATPCVDEITGTTSSIDVGGTATLTAKTSYTSENAKYAWTSSSDAIATVTGNGNTATVTGVAGGDATITCTLTDGDTTSSKTYAIKVNAAAATQKALTILETSKVEGAGVHVTFNPTATGMAFGNGITTYCNGLETSVKVIKGSQTVKASHFEQQGNTSTVFYVELNSAAVSGEFAVAVSFKDTTNNVVYSADVYFKDGKIAPSLSLSGSAKVVKGESIELTAEKGYFLDGDATYSFVSDDTDVATVVVKDNVATVTGIKTGTANITVTMTAGGKTYTATKAVTVTAEATVATALNPTSGKVEGAQFWLYGIDNTKLGVTGANLNQITAKVKIVITYNNGDCTDTAITPYLGEGKITSTSVTYQSIETNTVTFYSGLNQGLSADWDITWNIHIDLTNPSGDEFTIDCRFVKTTFKAGASD